ncbi:hypothetical protein [Hymenobacter koreensis]|uniref:hypothetical protein n=1 Tax=Hymenobacter koreensis TaxID=1084523 RepID=UPI0031EFA6FB
MGKLLAVVLGALLVWAAPVHGQVHGISLAAEKLLLLPSPVVITQVIDARPTPGAVGWVLKGPENAPTRADVVRGVGPEISRLLKQYLKPEPGARAVVLRLTQLQIVEQPLRLGESATAEVSIQLWAEQPNGYAYMGQAAATHGSKAMNVTTEHAGNITRALEKCLWHLLVQPLPETLPAPQPLATLQQPELRQPHTRFAIETDTVLRPGVYRDYLQFRNNMPEQLASATISSNQTLRGDDVVTAKPYYLDDKGHRTEPIRNVWGFSDGKQAFVYFYGQYYALERTPRAFRFRGPYQLSPEEAAERAALLAGFGLMGGIKATQRTPSTVTYEVNLRNGQVVKHGTQGLSLDLVQTSTESTSLVVYCRSESGPAVALAVNGEPLASALAAAGVVDIPCTESGAEIVLCVGSAPDNCLRFVPERSTTNYVEVRFNGTAAPSMRRVPGNLGEMHVRKLLETQ